MIAAIVLASALVDLTPEPSDWVAEAAKYEQQCAGKTTPDCKAMRWQLEYQLWQDVRAEYRGYTEVPEEVMQVAMAAEVPQLKAWAIDRIRHRGIRSPAEKELVIGAINDPYPVVRDEALDVLSQLGEEKLARMRDRQTSRRAPLHGYLPDTAPAIETYPGAKYWYFASSKERAFFTTPDSPQKVLAHFAKGGRKTLDEKQLEAALEAANEPGDPMAMARAMQEAMQKGKNPQDIINEMQNAAPPSVDADAGLSGQEGVVAPKWVVLQTTDFMGKKVPARFVMIFKDDAMGATAIVFPLPPVRRKGDFTDQAAIEREMKFQQELGPYPELD